MDAFFDYPGGAADDAPAAFLAGASEGDRLLLRDHMQVRRFPAGSTVLAPGDTDRALLLLVEGSLRTRAGRRTVTLPPGAVVGELAFLAGSPAAAEVSAGTDVQVLRLGLADFEALAAKEPAFGRYLLLDLARVLAERVRDLQALLGQRRP